MESSATYLADPPSDAAVTALYDEDLASDGYVNNLTRAWAWRPDVLAAFQGARSELVESSSLTPRELAVMVAATASARGDSYCSLAWGIRLAKLSDETTAAKVLAGEPADLSSREAALAQWSRSVVHDPNGITEADMDQLRRAGFGDREIFEATAWIAFRLAFSTINDALGAAPDRQLVDTAPELVREAVTFGRRPRSPRADRSAPPVD